MQTVITNIIFTIKHSGLTCDSSLNNHCVITFINWECELCALRILSGEDLCVYYNKLNYASKELAVGDEVEAKFISLDRKNRSLTLSIRALEDEELAEALEEYHSQNASSGTTSLGELLKEQLKQDS